MNFLFLLLLTLVTHTATAQPRKLSITSAHDKFDLILKSKTSGTVNGKPADMKVMTDLWPVTDSALGNECPSLPDPADVTITEKGQVRSLHLSEGIVTDGKMCLNVGGEGLFFFPIHRDFLIGAKRATLEIQPSLKVFRQGVKVLDLRKTEGKWNSVHTENKEQLLNWDFIERFENSLRQFDVRLRVQAEIAQGKPKMIVQNGDQSLEFYKITKVMWALKRPGQAWLEASDDWSFWYDFEQALIEDSYTAEIKTVQNVNNPREKRLAALKRLDETWSRNLRELYHRLLDTHSEDPEFKQMALKRLRSKPSLETSGVMVRFLKEAEDEELKALAGQVLKAHYPKGPLYKPTLSEKEKAKALEFWNNWWIQNQKGN